MLCCPDIVDSVAEINWDECGNPTGTVKVRAECEEDESSEKRITVSSAPATTTTMVTTTTGISCPYSCWTSCVDDNEPPICYKRISHGNAGCPGGSICCESILVECPSMTTSTTGVRKRPCPYECCIDMPEYEYKYCPPGLKCCNDHTCRDVCESSLRIKLSPLTAILVAIASFIPLVLFLLFMGVI